MTAGRYSPIEKGRDDRAGSGCLGGDVQLDPAILLGPDQLSGQLSQVLAGGGDVPVQFSAVPCGDERSPRADGCLDRPG